MKKVVQVQEVEGEGLEALLDREVIILCINYFYTGKLVGVNELDIILADPKIVYETGSWDSAGFSDVQALPAKEWRIRTACIESYGEVK